MYDLTLAVGGVAYSLFLPFVFAPKLAGIDPVYARVIPVGARLWLMVAVSLLASLTMLVRRRWPLIPAGFAAWDLWLGGVRVLYPLALYTLVVQGRYRLAFVYGLAGVARPVVFIVQTSGPPLTVQATGALYTFFLPYVIVPIMAAASARSHRLHIEVIRDYTRRLKREESLRARNARLEERARLAQDMHDVVAHHIGLAVVQANALEMRTKDWPEVVTTASLIGDLGRQAMEELRDLLDTLRSDPDVADQMSDDKANEAWLQRVEEIAARVRQSDTSVVLKVQGRLAHTQKAAGKVAFRVIQEGLSNAVRHAPGAAVEINVEANPLLLRVHVANGRPTRARQGRKPQSGQHGLTGMRERITQLGGTLVAGATADGGFRLSATIPTMGLSDDPRPSRRRRGAGAPGHPARLGDR